MKSSQTFGQAIEALKEGKMVSRAGWSDKGSFVFRQVPSMVPPEVIAKMTSLPPAVKAALTNGKAITYQDQFCIASSDNSLRGWFPTGTDMLSTDWEIHGEHVVAGETVGTATPI